MSDESDINVSFENSDDDNDMDLGDNSSIEMAESTHEMSDNSIEETEHSEMSYPEDDRSLPSNINSSHSSLHSLNYAQSFTEGFESDAAQDWLTSSGKKNFDDFFEEIFL